MDRECAEDQVFCKFFVSNYIVSTSGLSVRVISNMEIVIL